jgi:hypothetical protein
VTAAAPVTNEQLAAWEQWAAPTEAREAIAALVAEVRRQRAELEAERKAFAGVKQVERHATQTNERAYCGELLDRLADAHAEPVARAALRDAAGQIRARGAR